MKPTDNLEPWKRRRLHSASFRKRFPALHLSGRLNLGGDLTEFFPDLRKEKGPGYLEDLSDPPLEGFSLLKEIDLFKSVHRLNPILLYRSQFENGKCRLRPQRWLPDVAHSSPE